MSFLLLEEYDVSMSPTVVVDLVNSPIFHHKKVDTLFCLINQGTIDLR